MGHLSDNTSVILHIANLQLFAPVSSHSLNNNMEFLEDLQQLKKKNVSKFMNFCFESYILKNEISKLGNSSKISKSEEQL